MAVPPVIEISSSPSTQPRPASTSHRLPTVSASQALQDLQASGSGGIPTGLSSLDALLFGSSGAIGAGSGIERGKITELWGPSGAGKTAIALQTATHAIRSGNTVTWIDAATALSGQRLQSTLSPFDPSSASSADAPQRFRHIDVPTLSHLLAILLHPPPGVLPSQIGLLVIDGLNALVDLDYPRYQFSTSTKTEQQKWQAGRRYAVLGTLALAMNKLAVLNNLAVVVTTGCATRMRTDSGLGAALVPGMGGAEWEGGIWNRLAVFRDFSGRLVGVQKCQGKSFISREEVGEVGRIFGFDINSDGSLLERQSPNAASGALAQQGKATAGLAKPRKRIFDEIADSEGEDVDEYGWAETDDDVIVTEGVIGHGEVAEGATETV